MLELDPSKRATAAQIIKEPYIRGDDIRMTAFEMAGALSRQMGGRNYSRDHIKVAHNNAVEQLVRLTANLFREPKSTARKRSKLASKKACRVNWVSSLQTLSTKLTRALCCKASSMEKMKTFQNASSPKLKKSSPNLTANKRLKTILNLKLKLITVEINTESRFF